LCRFFNCMFTFDCLWRCNYQEMEGCYFSNPLNPATCMYLSQARIWICASTVMINNSINMNNYCCSLQIIEHKRSRNIQIQILAWERYIHVAGLSGLLKLLTITVEAFFSLNCKTRYQHTYKYQYVCILPATDMTVGN
jgi:hypothetical protein